MKWTAHVTCGGQERGIQCFGEEFQREDHLEDLGLDGKVILKIDLK
jgi:hypothetical protein